MLVNILMFAASRPDPVLTGYNWSSSTYIPSNFTVGSNISAGVLVTDGTTLMLPVYDTTLAKPAVLVATDISSWTQRNGIATAGLTAIPSQALWNGTHWIVAKSSTGAETRSSDGINWSTPTTTALFTSLGNTMCCDSTGQYVFVGGASPWRRTRSSDYGATWAYTSTTNGFQINTDLFVGSTIVVGGSYSAGYGCNIATSTDYGATLTAQTDLIAKGWPTGTHVQQMVYNGSQILVLGLGLQARSSDAGVTWTYEGQVLPSYFYVVDMAYNATSGVVCAVGYNSGDSAALVYTSTDYGATWQKEQKLINSGALGAPRGVVAFGTGFVAYGSTGKMARVTI